MDDEKLKRILEDMHVPEPDQNAKKRAVNMAMSAFEEQKKKKENKFQGLSFLTRLMGINNPKKERNPMNRSFSNKFMYGGMATAIGVVIVAGYITENFNKSGRGPVVTMSESDGLGKNDLEAINRNEEGAATPPPARNPDLAKVLNDLKNSSTQTQEAVTSHLVKPSKAPVAQARLKTLTESFAPSSSAPQALGAKSQSVAKKEKKAISADQNLSSNIFVDEGRDQFEEFEVNPIKLTNENPVSTFSVDVDTASYSFIRRQLNHGQMPQSDAIRIEEMINYFGYNYALPETRDVPFKPNVTVIDSPWSSGKKLMHIGIKGYDLKDEQPKSNLVFLLDVSGSMNAPDKLPLVKNSMKMLLSNLHPDDKVSIVVYAGAAGAVLEPTKVSDTAKIYAAFDNLKAGGSTAGAAGINLAYQLAEQNFDKDAVNRVILATDGDFNVGISSPDQLQEFVERKRKTGIFLSVLGFGQGNYNDHLMQVLAQNGNGIAAYIDNLNEARKVLVEEATSSLFPIAKDVKIQVEFNPAAVAEYRLVGYETRILKREDFNNDKIDAGDIGAGHTVTAIYEITPVGSSATSIDPLRYGSTEETQVSKVDPNFTDEYAFLKLRYKLPTETTSKLITLPVLQNAEYKQDMTDAHWATAVASFGQLLKGGQYAGNLTYDDVIKMAQEAKGEDTFGYRSEFITLVRLAKSVSGMQTQ